MKLLYIVLFPLILFGAPRGSRVTKGDCQIEREGSSVLIRQGSERAIIEWEEFSIREGESVRFIQPHERAAILNRVTGSKASRIMGKLDANGQVYLLNRNGILIGPDGHVASRGFVATTLGVSDESFWGGGMIRFSGDSQMSIENQGKLVGNVYLIAREVVQHGTIAGEQVVIVAGREVWACPEGDGRVAIKVSGDGEIELAAATIRAAGGDPYSLAVNADDECDMGGIIYLSSETIRVAPDADLRTGEGGTIEIFGDKQLVFEGEATSPKGLVEISTTGELVYTGHVSTVGRDGTTGLFLLDPTNIVVGKSASQPPLSEDGQYLPTGTSTAYLRAADIEAALQTNEVRLETNAGLGGTGTITIQESICWDSPHGLSLFGDQIILEAGVKIESAYAGPLNPEAIHMEARGSFPGSYVGISIASASLSAKSGSIVLSGRGGEGNLGIQIGAKSILETKTGPISLSGDRLMIEGRIAALSGALSIEGDFLQGTAQLQGNSVALSGKRIAWDKGQISGQTLQLTGDVPIDASGTAVALRGTSLSGQTIEIAGSAYGGGYGVVLERASIAGNLISIQGSSANVTSQENIGIAIDVASRISAKTMLTLEGIAGDAAGQSLGLSVRGSLIGDRVQLVGNTVEIVGPITAVSFQGHANRAMIRGNIACQDGEWIGADLAVTGALSGDRWTLTTDHLSLATRIRTNRSLTLQPLSNQTSIAIGMGNGSFLLPNELLSQLSPGVEGLTIGRETGAHKIDLLDARFTYPVSIRGNEISLRGAIQSTSSLVLAIGQTSSGVFRCSATIVAADCRVIGGPYTDRFFFDTIGSKLIVQGGVGGDLLIGPEKGTVWNLTGVDRGMLGAVSFQNIPHLVGGSGDDVFLFMPGGSVTGSIDGSGGVNGFDYRSFRAPVTVDLATSSATGCPLFVHIQSFSTKTRGSTFIAPDQENEWTLASNQSGYLNHEIYFSGFTNLVGGGNRDVFDMSNGKGWAGTLDGRGGDNLLIGPDSETLWEITGQDTGNMGTLAFTGIQSLQGGLGADTFVFDAGQGISGTLVGGGPDSINIIVSEGGFAPRISGGFRQIGSIQSFSSWSLPTHIPIPNLSFSLTHPPAPPSIAHDMQESLSEETADLH